MKSILDLQIAVLGEDNEAVQDILSEIDRKTESQMYMKAAEEFGFQTIEHHGRRLAMRRQIAKVMGYMDESGLRKLCERHDLETVSMGTFGQSVRDIAVRELGLKRNDGKSIFIGWDAFLLGGMQGTTAEAKKIQLYLLSMERAGRVASGAIDITKARASKISEADKVVSMVARAERISNQKLKQATLKYLDEVLEGALVIPEQLLLLDEKRE